jgi:hypothetical protein
MEDFIKIRLRFPKARIEINNFMLENHGDCSQALVAASRKYEIIVDPSFETPLEENETTCQALHTAEAILRKYLEEKKIKEKAKHIATFKTNVHLFKTLEYQRSKSELKCLRLTPVIFDLLLQQIECT